MTITPLSEDQLAWLMEFFSTPAPGKKIRRVRREETLFEKGDKVARIFFVVNGQIRINAMHEGKIALHEIRGPGSWIAEDAFLGRPRRRYTAVAATGGDVVEFELEAFFQSLNDHQALTGSFLKAVTTHLDEIQTILEDRLFNSADKRAARAFLNMFVGDTDVLAVDMTPKRLGELIGATRQTAHTIMDGFRAKSMIVKKGQDLYHLHRGPLEKFLAAKPRAAEKRPRP